MNDIQKSRAGQTALEYLLIVVVAITVVVAVMVWMNAASSGASGTATKNTNEFLCRSTSCSSDSVCDATPACTLSGFADCIGVQTTGSAEIPGHCEPLGLSGGAICNSSFSCSDFGYTMGTMSCGNRNASFDLTNCSVTGMFTELLDAALGWQAYGYLASGDTLGLLPVAICGGSAGCTGASIRLLNGPAAGSYTIRDWGRNPDGTVYGEEGGGLGDAYPILGPDFTNQEFVGISWRYRMYGTSRSGSPECGNGVLEPYNGEECEPSGYIPTCARRGYSGGAPACKPVGDPEKCTVDETNCYLSVGCNPGFATNYPATGVDYLWTWDLDGYCPGGVRANCIGKRINLTSAGCGVTAGMYEVTGIIDDGYGRDLVSVGHSGIPSEFGVPNTWQSYCAFGSWSANFYPNG